MMRQKHNLLSVSFVCKCPSPRMVHRSILFMMYISASSLILPCDIRFQPEPIQIGKLDIQQSIEILFIPCFGHSHSEFAGCILRSQWYTSPSFEEPLGPEFTRSDFVLSESL